MSGNSIENDAIGFQALFESAPGLFVAVKPDFTIVAASNAFLQATMTERSALAGLDILNVLPSDPDNPSSPGVRNLRASLCRVLEDKVPDVMAIQKCDVWRPGPNGGGVEERFWSAVNTPVFDSNQNIQYIIHWVEDVTDVVRLRNEQPPPPEREGDLDTAHRLGTKPIDLIRIPEEPSLKGIESLDRIGNLAFGIAHDLSSV